MDYLLYLSSIKYNSLSEDTTISQSNQSLNKLYTEGNFEDVFSKLETSKGSSEYHYNLGTVYAKNSELVKARKHLELAYKDGYAPTQTLNNLNYVKQKLGVVNIEEPLSIEENILVFSESIPDFAIISFPLIVLILNIYFIKQLSKYIIVLLLVICTLPYGLKTFESSVSRSLSSKDLKVHEGPSEIFESLKEAPAGVKLYIKKIHDGWALISYPQDLRGWVREEDLLTLEGLK